VLRKSVLQSLGFCTVRKTTPGVGHQQMVTCIIVRKLLESVFNVGYESEPPHRRFRWTHRDISSVRLLRRGVPAEMFQTDSNTLMSHLHYIILYRTRKLVFVYKNTPLYPILSQLNPVHILVSVRPILISLSHLDVRSARDPSPLVSPTIRFLHLSVPCLLHAPSISSLVVWP
jgi:hypothetical protein